MRRSVRAIAAGWLAVVILAVSLVGTVWAATEKKPYAGTTLKVVAWRSTWATALAETLKEMGQEMGINVEVLWFNWPDIPTKVTLDARAKAPTYDILSLTGEQLIELYEADAVQPLDPLFKKFGNSKVLAWEDFIKVEREAVTIKGRVYGFPQSYNANMIVYREDLFNNPTEKAAFKERYGYELAVPQYYDQYLDIAEFFTRKKGNLLAGKSLENDFFGTVQSNKKGDYIHSDYMSFYMAFGADNICDNNMKPTFNSPESRATLKFYAELSKFMPSGHFNMSSGEADRVLASGQAALMIEYVDRISADMMDPKTAAVWDKINVAATQSRRGYPQRAKATMSSTCIASMYKYSPNPEAAFKLLERVHSRESQKKMAIKYANKHLPARLSVVNDAEVQEKNRLAKWMRPLEPHLFKYRNFLGYAPSWDIASDYIHKAMLGEMSANEAGYQGQKELEKLFRQYGYIK